MRTNPILAFFRTLTVVLVHCTLLAMHTLRESLKKGGGPLGSNVELDPLTIFRHAQTPWYISESMYALKIVVCHGILGTLSPGLFFV